jgi:hypothetical protein
MYDGHDVCQCNALRAALDQAGETIARIGDQCDSWIEVARSLGEQLAAEAERARGLRLELDVAQQEAAGAFQ